MPGFIGAKHTRPNGHVGAKGSGHAFMSHKSGVGYGGTRVPVFDRIPGRGDIGGGGQVHGNTANPVASGQRDSMPKNFRVSGYFDKRKPAAKLESRKRNKRD